MKEKIEYSEEPLKIFEKIKLVCKNSKFDFVKKTPSIIKRYHYLKTKIGGFLVFKNDECVSFLVFFECKKHLYMLKIFTSDRERNRGYGYKLIQLLKEKAKAKEKVKIRWKCDIDNVVANKFYKKIDFDTKVIKKEKFIYEMYLDKKMLLW